VTDFTRKNLSGARFEDVNLTGADFHSVDLTDAHFRVADLTRVTISGSALKDMDISGQIDNVRINGVDVVPLVEAELDRRHPGRAKMRPGDAAGYREAWDVLERLWQQTVARARRMDLRADRMATVREVLGSLTDEQLAGMTQPVTEPGYPEPESFPVARCLGAVLHEEWQHRLYAERDLDALERQPS
jgi:hypothetical protein